MRLYNFYRQSEFRRITMRKRKFTSLLTAIILTASLLFPASISVAAAQTDIGVAIDGNAIQFSTDTGAPFIDSANRTQVPLRVTMEAFGANVSWDDQSKTALVAKDAVSVSVPIGISHIEKNGTIIPNDTAAQIVNGKTYLPIRAVFEAFGATVSWNQTTHTVTASTTAQPVAASTTPTSTVTYPVVRVKDGDTIVVNLNGTQETVRLIGIDTPESVHPDASRNVPYGTVASAFTKSKLEGQNVELELDVQERDKYGRILAYVYIDGQMFNKTLLSEGHAKVATYPPNVKYVNDFTALQKDAQTRKVGLWALESTNTSPTVAKTTPKKVTPAIAPTITASGSYVGNKNSKIFHYSDCSSVGKMKSSNKVYFNSRNAAVNAGYRSCKVCRP